MTSTKPKIDPFTFHGLVLSNDGDQLRGDCPFCHKAGHFYSSLEWRWDCKRCGETGNLFTFLSRLIETSLEAVTDDTEFQWLTEHRNIPTVTFRRHKVCPSAIDGTWLVPTLNLKGSVVNIHRYVHRADKDSWELIGTPTCKAYLYGLQYLPQKKDSDTGSHTRPVWIAEGHWDYLVLDYCLRKQKLRKQIDLLAVPGANTWKADWCDLIRDRDVVLLYDYDDAGEKGIQRVIKVCEGSLTRPRSIATLPWQDAVAEAVVETPKRRRRRVRKV